MKKLLSLVLTLLMVLSLTASAMAAEGKTQIVFWYSLAGTNAENIVKMVDRFNASQDKIFVDAQYQGEYDDAINKLKAAGMGELPCDVVQTYEIGSRFLMDSGWIVPLQQFIDAEGWDTSVIEPNLLAYYTVEGKINAMPFNCSTPLMYYNKTAFDEAGITEIPTTVEGILEIAPKLTTYNDDGTVKRYGFMFSNYGWFFEQWMGKMGLHYVDNNNGRGADPATKVVFDETGGAEAIFNVWKRLIDDGVITYLGRGNNDAKAAFISGNIAITLESTAALKSLLVNVGDNFEIGTGYFPNIHPDDEGGVSIGGGSLWMLNTGDDARQNASWEFVKYMISPDVQAFWNAETGYFPITVATHELDAFKDNLAQYPQFGTAIDQLHSTAPQYSGALLSVFPEARSLVETYTERLINGEMDVAKTVENLAKEINSAIEIYNLTN